MTVVRGIRSEFIKLRHTAVLWLHFLIPVLGAIIFLLYFALYRNTENMNKMVLVLELTAVVFPIIVSVVCGMMGALEEKAGHFQGMMMSPAGRVMPYLNKLLAAVLLGGISTVLLAGFTVVGSTVFSLAQLSGRVFWGAALAMFLGTIPLYIIHTFLSIQWGLSASVFVGIAESLLAVMFSNVDTVIWPFLPCAWGVKFLQNTLFAVPMPITETGIVIALSAILLILSFVWFGRWEDRKSFE
jgi:ABC-2 type transport system permease protein